MITFKVKEADDTITEYQIHPIDCTVIGKESDSTVTLFASNGQVFTNIIEPSAEVFAEKRMGAYKELR